MQTIYTWGAQGLISDRINLQTTSQSEFYEFDATGSTRALLDQNGVGLSRGTYSACGSSAGYSTGTRMAWNGRAGIYTDAPGPRKRDGVAGRVKSSHRRAGEAAR